MTTKIEYQESQWGGDDMSKDIEVNFEKYTVIMCNNVNCKHNRRVIGDLHCNFKFITIDTEGKCKHFVKREE